MDLLSSSSFSSLSSLSSVGALTIVVVVVVVSLVVSILFNFLNKRSYSKPESYPLQNTIEVFVNQHRLLDSLQENLRTALKERGISTVDLNLWGLPRLVFTNSVQNVEHVLKTNFNNYGKGPLLYRRFWGLFGDGIFNSDGDIWYHHRKVSSNIFSMTKFKTTILDTFNQKLDLLILKLNSTQGTADFQDLMFRFTLDSIGMIAFNVQINALTQDRVQFAEDFDYCQETTNSSFIDPLWFFNRYFTLSGWHYFTALSRINAFAYKIINERRESMKQSNDDINDLLSIYLKSNPDITNKELRDVIINFIIAGRDTTAQAVSWMMFELCCHKHIQEKARQEIRDVIKESANDTNNSIYGDIQRLKYWYYHHHNQHHSSLELICHHHQNQHHYHHHHHHPQQRHHHHHHQRHHHHHNHY